MGGPSGNRRAAFIEKRPRTTGIAILVASWFRRNRTPGRLGHGNRSSAGNGDDARTGRPGSGSDRRWRIRRRRGLAPGPHPGYRRHAPRRGDDRSPARRRGPDKAAYHRCAACPAPGRRTAPPPHAGSPAPSRSAHAWARTSIWDRPRRRGCSANRPLPHRLTQKRIEALDNLLFVFLGQLEERPGRDLRLVPPAGLAAELLDAGIG